MALIECPECGAKVSDRANACPRCGYPFEEDRLAEEEEREYYNEIQEQKKQKMLFFAVMAIGFIIPFFLSAGWLGALLGFTAFLFFVGLGCVLVKIFILTQKPMDFRRYTNLKTIWAFSTGAFWGCVIKIIINIMRL